VYEEEAIFDSTQSYYKAIIPKFALANNNEASSGAKDQL
jgi:hypothetical protein